MTRRLALAVALAFTTVVTFALVAIGAQAGLFGGGGNDGAPAEASVGETATGRTATPEPTVITEYIYIDQTVTPEAGSAPSPGGSDSASGSGSDVSQSDGVDADDAAFEEHDDDHDDDAEHQEFEHEEDDD